MTAIQLAKRAVGAKDAGSLASAMVALFSEAPDDWDQLLLLHATPDPNTPAFRQVLSVHAEAARLVAEDSSTSADGTRLLRHMLTLAHFQLQFEKTDEVFYATAAWKERDTAKIWRCCAALQSQNRILRGRISDHAIKQDVFDPYAASASFLKHPVTGNSTDVVTQAERGVEATELILRATLHVSAPSGPPDETEVKSPYDDADFANMREMAARFLFLHDVWQLIKFSRWKVHLARAQDSLGEQRNIVQVIPADEQDSLRRHLSYTRANLFESQEYVPDLVWNKGAFTDTPGRLQQLAQSLIHPPVGTPWDGAHNWKVLRNAIEYTGFHKMVELFVHFHHYSAWIEELEKARRVANQPDWKDYLNVRAALNVLGHGFESAAAKLPEVDGHGCLRQVIRIPVATLTDVLAKALNLPTDKISSIVGELILNPKARGSEWWDCPLVPLSDNDILFVPTVAVNGNPARTVEHMVAKFTDQNSLRSRSFEAAATEHFERLPGCQVARNVAFQASDGKPVEFDVITHWMGYLLLIEVKCLRSVSSPYEEYRAKIEIEKAIGQLKRRRDLLATDWDALCKNASHLELPKDPISRERVIPIAVSNLMTFTGMSDDGVIVTDHFCLRRFFSKDPRIMGTDYSLGAVKWREYGRVRRSNDPNPAELREYLLDPPQTQLEHKKQWLWLFPALGLTPTCVASMEFTGERPRLQPLRKHASPGNSNGSAKGSGVNSSGGHS